MFKRILVALDGSKQSQKALDAAFSLAKSAGRGAKVFTASVCQVIPDTTSAQDTERIELLFSKIQQDAARKARAKKIPFDAETLFGAPAQEIADYAKKIKADLVVLGYWETGAKGNTGRLVLGSVSSEAVKLAKASVLVVK